MAWSYAISTVCTVCGNSLARHPDCPASAAELFEAACLRVLLPQDGSGTAGDSPSEPPAAAAAGSNGPGPDGPSAAAAIDQPPHEPAASSSSAAAVSDEVERPATDAATGQGSTAAVKLPGPGDEGSVALLRRVRAFCHQAVTALQRGSSKGRSKGQATGAAAAAAAGKELDAGVAERVERLACMQFGVERFTDLVAHGSVTHLLDGTAHGGAGGERQGQELVEEEGGIGCGAGVYALAMVASGIGGGAGSSEGAAEMGLAAVAELLQSVCVKTRAEGNGLDDGMMGELLVAAAAAMGLDPTAAAAAAAVTGGPLAAAGCGGLTEVATRLSAVVLPAPVGGGGGGAMGGGVAAVVDPAAATGERFAKVGSWPWVPVANLLAVILCQ